jgi:hypothetical protein
MTQGTGATLRDEAVIQRARLGPLRDPCAMSLDSIAHVNKYYTYKVHISPPFKSGRLLRGFTFPLSSLVPYETLALYHTPFHQYNFQGLILGLSRDIFLDEILNTSGSYRRTNLVKRFAAHLTGSLGPPSIYQSVGTHVMT